MNDEERSELEQLKQRLAQLQAQLAALNSELRAFEARLSLAQRSFAPTGVATHVAPPKIADAAPARPAPVEPPLAAPRAIPKPPQPPVIPPVISTQPAAPACAGRPSSGRDVAPVTHKPQPLAQVAALASGIPRPAPGAVTPAKASAFEIHVGTYWLVRIGIVITLTGLVFLGNLAYQNVGPGGKLALLYMAGAILLGVGAWLQRKQQKESVRNYAQVLFAGGLAEIYFTTYAAHHIETLRVIGDPLLDGVLLLIWAAFIVWIADRRKSEVLGLFAVGLAFYTSVITRVGLFTLCSNLVLVNAAVLLLVRNRWALLSYASVIASYAGYAFWRFYQGPAWRWASPEEGLWYGAYFLMSYWVVFTVGAFFSRHERLTGGNRAGFVTLNNVVFFALYVLTMWQVRHGGFWKFALIFGAVLLGLVELARRTFPAEGIVRNSYLTQGLLLVTVGLIARFSGLQLALLLAAESVVLLTLGTQRRSLLLQIGACVTAALSVAWGVDSIGRFDPRGLLSGAAVGAMMLFNARWMSRVERQPGRGPFRARTAYFSVLALLVWLVTTWNNTTQGNLPPVLATEALLFTVSIYLLRVRELGMLGQGYLVLAHLLWLGATLEPAASSPWWKPALLIVLTLALSHWWQRQNILNCSRITSQLWQGIYSLGVVGVLYYWLEPHFAPPVWLVLTSVLAMVVTVYGLLTRAWLLASCGQIFLVVSGLEFAQHLWESKPEWYWPLAPILALGLLVWCTVRWFELRPGMGEEVRRPLLHLALFYRWVALAMSLWWVVDYIPARERFWFLSLLGLIAFLWAGWRRSREALLFSATFVLSGLTMFWFPLHGAATVYWPNLLAIGVLLGQQQLGRLPSERFRLEPLASGATIVLGGLSLWLLLSRWILQQATGFYLTASWSALALVFFVGGIALRERVYRWLGLAILACALGRVVVLDVWKLETIYRVLSFLALGIVLLVLGFIYNKYQEKLREWL